MRGGKGGAALGAGVEEPQMASLAGASKPDPHSPSSLLISQTISQAPQYPFPVLPLPLPATTHTSTQPLESGKRKKGRDSCQGP